MKRDFNKWLKTFRKSIANYSYYTDYNTAYKNIEKVKREIDLLNSLVGSNDIENDFETLILRYPGVLKAIPILLAKRELEILCTDDKGSIRYEFKTMSKSIEQYKYFMRETGIFNLLENNIVSNLADYVLGVEVGLGSHGRKNRGGTLMEDLVESYIVKAGYQKDKNYFRQMRLSDLEKFANLDLSKISNQGDTEKIFDFVIMSSKCVYGCECNFYASQGSKLNETARSYKTLFIESKEIKGFKFVWFTDGIGWISAKNNLKETFDVSDNIYNIKDLENGIIKTF
ncbi:MAG: restriction endonuclease [Clostridiales bacterium]|nr:restriction endonuclease [Clostridiales bacterium]